MRNQHIVFLLYAIATSHLMPTKASDDFTLTATASLRDGSTIKGTLLTDTVKGAAIFNDSLELSLTDVKSLAFAGTNGKAKATLINGDILSLTVATPAFDMDTTLGKLSLVHNNIISLSLSKRQSSASNSNGLVFYCTFDNQASVETPMVGPAGKYLDGHFTSGKVGDALRLPPYTPCATFDLPEGFIGEAGCIEMWIKIENRSTRIGAGGDPRLFMIFDKTNLSFPILNIDIVNNDGGGNSGVSSYSPMGHTSSISGFGYNLSYQQIFAKGDWREWHHIALVWDSNGVAGIGDTRKTVTFIDGEPLRSATETYRSKESIAKLISAAYLLCFTADPGQNSEPNTKSPFLIDEFKIWNYAKTEFDLQ